MGFFECCHYCKAPKRYPGCHAECPDYIESKKLWDKCREAEKAARALEESYMTPMQIRRKHRRNRK